MASWSRVALLPSGRDGKKMALPGGADIPPPFRVTPAVLLAARTPPIANVGGVGASARAVAAAAGFARAEVCLG